MSNGSKTHVLVVCGPAGSGKSTIAKSLAADLGYDFLEGDSYHSKDAVQRMSENLPLTDADRWDWLIRLREAVRANLEKGALGVVLSCSALKEKYRDVLRILMLHNRHVVINFVYLKVPLDALVQRVQARQGHYMKDSMVASQLASLEEPNTAEEDVMTVDASGTLSSVCGTVKIGVAERMRVV